MLRQLYHTRDAGATLKLPDPREIIARNNQDFEDSLLHPKSPKVLIERGRQVYFPIEQAVYKASHRVSIWMSEPGRRQQRAFSSPVVKFDTE